MKPYKKCVVISCQLVLFIASVFILAMAHLMACVLYLVEMMKPNRKEVDEKGAY